MIAKVVLIYLLEIDRSDYIHKGVSFAPNDIKKKKINNAVLIDANSLTHKKSLTIGVFSFCVKNFRCRSPPSFNFKNLKLNGGKKDGRTPKKKKT